MASVLTACAAMAILGLGIWGGIRSMHRAILIGLVAGVVCGVLVAIHREPEALADTPLAFVIPLATLLGPMLARVVEGTGIIGRVFVEALKLVIMPLILATVVTGVTSVGNLRQLGRIGAKTLLYYATTTALAVTVGLLVVNAVEPGRGADLTGGELTDSVRERVEASANQDMGDFIQDQVLSVLVNPFRALATGDVLPTIFFALLLGAVIANLGSRGEPLAVFFSALSDAMMRMVDWILVLAPAGAFALLATQIAQSGLGVLATLAKYMVTVLLGLGIHALVTLPLLLVLLGRMSVRRFTGGMRDAIVLAFSTSSSSATLPVTLECITEKLRVKPHVASFVLPLGATINMDGTALYEAVAVMTIAQAYGFDLALNQQVTIFLTATLASIGAAGIPSAGLFMMVIVLRAVGLPLEGIGIILAVDRILDMCRTTVNVVGDAVGAVVINASERTDGAPAGPGI